MTIAYIWNIIVFPSLVEYKKRWHFESGRECLPILSFARILWKSYLVIISILVCRNFGIYIYIIPNSQHKNFYIGDSLAHTATTTTTWISGCNYTIQYYSGAMLWERFALRSKCPVNNLKWYHLKGRDSEQHHMFRKLTGCGTLIIHFYILELYTGTTTQFRIVPLRQSLLLFLLVQ